MFCNMICKVPRSDLRTGYRFFQIMLMIFLLKFLVIIAPPRNLMIVESFLFGRLRSPSFRWRFNPRFSLDFSIFITGPTAKSQVLEGPGTPTTVM